MFHFLFLLWRLSFPAVPLYAAGGEIKMISSFADNSPQEILSPVFSGSAASKLPYGYSVENAEGRNGTSGLVYRRDNPDDYAMMTFPLPGLRPGTVYQAEVWVRGENLQQGKDRNMGLICVQFSRDRKYFSGVFPHFAVSSDGAWKRCVMQFSMKENADDASVLLYLRKGWTGKVVFSDLAVRTAGDTQTSVILNQPDRLTVSGDQTGLRFTVTAPGGEYRHLRLLVRALQGNRRQEFLLCPDESGKCRQTLSRLAEGNLRIETVLADMRKRQVLCRESFELQVLPGHSPAVRVDEKGILRIKGNAFFPIGIFTGSLSEADLERISRAGINTVLPYASISLAIGGKAATRAEELLRSLDVIEKYGLKIVFSLKDQYSGKNHARLRWDQARGVENVAAAVAETLRNHPALLAWYISDEDTRGEVPNLIRMRRLLSLADPDHPTVVLTFRKNDFPYYAGGGDISGVDDYPIRDQSSRTVRTISELICAASLSGNPVWGVPQVFNWGGYKAKTQEEFRRYRYPSEEEIRTMTLLNLVHGAKGIIFYHYTDIFRRAEKFDPGSSEREWRKVCSVVRDLQLLTPFLVSGVPAENLDYSSCRQVEACMLLDGGGRAAVLLCGVGPGKNEALFRLPGKKRFHSLYGYTKQLSSGWYKFETSDIGCDILMEEDGTGR